MEEEAIKKALARLREEADKNKKKFSQSIDLVITLRASKSKAKDVPLDFVVDLPHKVRETRTCAFIDKDLQVQAAGNFSTVIAKDDLAKYDKKQVRKTIQNNDVFFAEASIMSNVAAKFGKQLAAKGKMPNPKTNTILTPASNLKNASGLVAKMIKINTSKNKAVTVKVGDQASEDKVVTENTLAVYNAIKSLLPNGDAGIKHTYLKVTMGKPVAI